MVREENDEIPFIDDTRDLDVLLSQFNEKLGDLLSIDIAKGKYEGKVWNCIYIDIGDIKDNH